MTNNESQPRYVGVKRIFSNKTGEGTKKLSCRDGCTTDEENRILQTINSSSLNKLKSYGIKNARLKIIAAYRNEGKHFETLDDVLMIQGIGADEVERFCESVLKGPKESHQCKTRFTGNLMSPPLNKASRSAIATLTGIWFCGTTISWVRMDTSCNVLEWKLEEVDISSARSGTIDLVDSVLRILSEITPSDAYVLESEPYAQFSRMHSSSYCLYLLRQQIIATVVTVLGTRLYHKIDEEINGDARIKNVYLLRPHTTARLFDLLVGKESVSTRPVVENIMGLQGFSSANGRTSEITASIQPAAREYWKSREPHQREQMNWALLLTLAFLHLAVRQTAILKTRTPSTG